jgi:DNA repair protein RadD
MSKSRKSRGAAMISLYEDQEEFIGEIRKLWRDHKRIMGMAGTGFGKTRVAARVIEGCVKAGWKVCFIVPRISLMAQTSKAFIELGLEDITYLWGSYETDYSAKITIASADTYIRRPKGEYDLVIVDEAHHRRRQLLEWMESHPEERYLGLSATPFAPWIGEYYTALAKAKPMRWLIDNGRLSEYEIFAPEVPDTSELKTHATAYGNDFRESDLEEIMGGAQVVGNIVQNWLEHGENRRTMALCVNVAHANHVTIQFQRAGISAEVVTAATPTEERERIFERLRKGITLVLCSVNALTEGFDVPQVSCIINARPTRSLARYVQGMGRGLRVAEGKINCLIFDHSGTTLDLGMPEDISIDELGTGSDGQDESGFRLAEEKTEKKPKECPSCKYVKPAGVYVCPKCGFKPIMGQDVEVDESRGLKKINGKVKKWSAEEKQEVYSELLGYQRERAAQGKPVSDGYIAHTYRERIGVWPKGLQKYPKVPSPETRNFIKHKNIKFAKGKAKHANG